MLRHMTRDEQARIRDAIGDLARRGVLDDAQAGRVTEAVTAALGPDPRTGAAPTEPRARFAEIAGYVGGAVTAGATMLLIAQSWDDLSRAGRVASLAIAVALVVAGAAIGGGTLGKLRALGQDEESPRRRLVSTLFTLAAAAAAGAAGAAIDRHEPVAASVAGLVVVGLGYALVPALIGQLGTWAAAAALVMSGVDEATQDDLGVIGGLALIALGITWAALARRNVFAEPYVGLGIGAATTLLGAQFALMDQRNLSYALTALVAAACFAGFVVVRNWLVLATGVLAVVLVVPEALNDWTDGGLGGAALLLAAGVALLAASGVGLRLRQR
jgi:hypothetical protein